MKELLTYINRLNRMDEMIRHRSTGPPREFAGRIGICERTFHDYMILLKDIVGKFGVSIVYNYDLDSYEYDSPGRLDLRCS